MLAAGWLAGAGAVADAALLYDASLRNGAYGGGFVVDTFTSCSDADGSSCGDGDLGNIGITDSSAGVMHTANNAVINYSIGRDYATAVQNTFRAQGTVSVRFFADGSTFTTGQPFTDNYGFNQFRSGQGTFGTGFSRHAGVDGVLNTGDDQVSVGWSTWHSNTWHSHVTAPVLLDLDAWHHIGFAWGGADNDFEIWVNGMRVATHDLPAGTTQSWGASYLGLGSGYNFALGEIHERAFGNGSAHGITYADLEIWSEYRADGATLVPLPASAWLAAGALAPLLRRRRTAARR